MKNKREEAQRFNSGKPELSYIDLTSLEDTARVFAFGAQKYSRDNWKKGQKITSILDSMMRHIAAIQRGEFLDLNSEGKADASYSGLPHHAHIGCNAIFLANTFRNHPDLINFEGLSEKAKEYYSKLGL